MRGSTESEGTEKAVIRSYVHLMYANAADMKAFAKATRDGVFHASRSTSSRQQAKAEEESDALLVPEATPRHS